MLWIREEEVFTKFDYDSVGLRCREPDLHALCGDVRKEDPEAAPPLFFLIWIYACQRPSSLWIFPELFCGSKQRNRSLRHSRQASFLHSCFLAEAKKSCWKLFQETINSIIPKIHILNNTFDHSMFGISHIVTPMESLRR